MFSNTTATIIHKPIYRINCEDDSELDMSGKSLKYCIILNNDGQILFLNASNGKYNIEIDKNQSFEDLKRENVNGFLLCTVGI